MCGIAGFCNTNQNYLSKSGYYKKILEDMANRLHHRGPDEQGFFLHEHVGFAHARLSIIDLNTGQQPMIYKESDKTYVISYNGEIYNMNELKNDLIQRGMKFTTTSDTEVLLLGYLSYGADFVKKLNGIFAYAIADLDKNRYCLYRDPVGIKPLFYYFYVDTLIFSSEIKGIFEYPGIYPTIRKQGLNEIFALGPAKTPGSGVYDGVKELLPGHMLTVSPSGFNDTPYWKLTSKPHEDSYEETIEKTSFLITDAIKMQMISDVPISTFLSGGIDSSIVSAVCANELKKKNKQLDTFSFDFINNDQYFKANSFQPSRDLPYVKKMVEFLGSNHRFLICDNVTMANRLADAVDARDLPCMADIESSLLHFCSLVKPYDKVVLTGECADEIFGGYPWFHSKEAFTTPTFPWSRDLTARKSLLSDEFLDYLQIDDYISNTYETSISMTPRLESDTEEEARRREISYLNLRWFMQTLLDRMDRTSMYVGLEARVPFADIRIIEYLWNVPWEMKKRGDIEKSLLRHAVSGLVPDEILWRKKSPYPKTYDPEYETLVAAKLTEIVNDPASPLLQFIDKKKLNSFINTPSDYGKPWYGQLMAGPQTLAYLIQVNEFLLPTNHKKVPTLCLN